MPEPPARSFSASVPWGVELELELAGEELPFELLVLADVRGGHLADALGVQQHAESPVIHSAVVAHDAEVARPLREQRLDERDRVARESEPADSEAGSVRDVGDGLGRRSRTSCRSRVATPSSATTASGALRPHPSASSAPDASRSSSRGLRCGCRGDVVSTLWNDRTACPGRRRSPALRGFCGSSPRRVTPARACRSWPVRPSSRDRRLTGCCRLCAPKGWSTRTNDTTKWMPGPELFLMGTVAAARYDVTGTRPGHRALPRRENGGERLPLRAPRGRDGLPAAGRRQLPDPVVRAERRACAFRSVWRRRVSRFSPSCPSRRSRRISSGMPSCPSASGAAHARQPLRARHRETLAIADTPSTRG